VDVLCPRRAPTEINNHLRKRARQVLGAPSRAVDRDWSSAHAYTTTPAQESERLLAAAESSVIDSVEVAAALAAIGHAILTLSPRRARHVERKARHASNNNGPQSYIGRYFMAMTSSHSLPQREHSRNTTFSAFRWTRQR